MPFPQSNPDFQKDLSWNYSTFFGSHESRFRIDNWIPPNPKGAPDCKLTASQAMRVLNWEEWEPDISKRSEYINAYAAIWMEYLEATNLVNLILKSVTGLNLGEEIYLSVLHGESRELIEKQLKNNKN